MKEPKQDIFTCCKAGDHEAFKMIVQYYQSFAFALAFRMIPNEEDARDIVQEAFIRVWKHKHHYNVNRKFTTWLYRIVINLCYDHLRFQRRKENVIQRHQELRETTSDQNCYDLENKISNREMAARIQNLVQELTPKQRMVFILRDLQDLEMKEVAGILKISVGSVKSNLYYARRNIREKLENLENNREIK